MPLVNMTTNLKSLRFGKDTVGGGNSPQPFVVRDIPDDLSDVGRTGGPDFLLRGGSLYPRIAVNDTVRISKLFYPGRGGKINTTNLDDPLGVDASGNGRRPVNLIGTLFTAKQNILSLTNVNSDVNYKPFVENRATAFPETVISGTAIGNFIRDNLALNQGIYTPLSTIAQAPVNALGIHLNKQGLNPFTQTTVGSPDGNTPLGLPTYLNTISTPSTNQDTLGRKSRLEPLAVTKMKKQEGSGADITDLYSYNGGPGSTLGVGKTNIKMISEYRTGANNVKSQFWVEAEKGKNQYFTKQFVRNVSSNADVGLFGKNALLSRYLKNINGNRDIGVQIIDTPGIETYPNSVYLPGTIKLKTDTAKLRSGINESIPRQVWTQAEIESKEPFSKSGKTDNIKDFRKIVAPSGSEMIPNTLPYTDSNKYEQRVNLGNPGKKANRSSYTIGRRDVGSTINTVEGNADYTHALDKVNALPIYKSSAVAQADAIKNDFVKFRIGVIDNDNPSKKTFIHFRAIIDSMQDAYSSEWDSLKYMGRGEKFYKYQGFDRQISLSWTVAAQSKQELIPMYQKLNYLASVNAPDYSRVGYMGGNLISLTIGGWCYEQVGVMNGLTLSVPEESPWEISIPDEGSKTFSSDGSRILTDPSVKELPMIVKVTGFTFNPIHNFLPQIQQNGFSGAKLGSNGKFASSYGVERYLALANGASNNYSGGLDVKNDKHINYLPKKSGD